MSSALARAARRTNTHTLVKTVAIVGGTHGNETNGVYLAKHFLQPDGAAAAQRVSFETRVLLANHDAIAANQRYVDTDMNRCFFLADLADSSLVTREQRRAKELDALLGPKASASPAADFIIDLHNTTSCSGVALMMAPDDAFSHEVALHLVGIDPEVRIVRWSDAEDYSMLPSVGRSGLTFEVGAAPCGCLMGEWYAQSRKLVLAALDFVEEHNNVVSRAAAESAASAGAAGKAGAAEGAGGAGAGGSSPKRARTEPPAATLTAHVFSRVCSVDYPRDTNPGGGSGSGDLAAMIHPALQGSDFRPLAEGAPLFMRLDGSTVPFAMAEHGWDEAAHGAAHPLFVNEAAYYEKGVALVLAKRTEVQVEVHPAKVAQAAAEKKAAAAQA